MSKNNKLQRLSQKPKLLKNKNSQENQFTNSLQILVKTNLEILILKLKLLKLRLNFNEF